MISLIGLGLNLAHITNEAIELARSCDELFLDSYTSPLPFSRDSLVDLLGKDVNLVGREELESDYLIDIGMERKIGVLTMGDPLTATTHSSLLSRAMGKRIEVKYIPGISIITVASSLLGLHHYKFGRIVTIPHPSKGRVESPYQQMAENYPLHTLILLDSDPVLSAEEAISCLSGIERSEGYRVFDPDRTICVISRACLDDEEIWVGSIKKVNRKFKTPGVLALPGELHFSEEENLSRLAPGKLNFSVKQIKNRVESRVLDRYISITENALGELEGIKLTETEEKYLETGRNYYKDGLYFKNKGDYVRAYGAINYGHAFLDAIKINR